ncbi:HET-domain-containing protein [Annulohypoxylon maeteangense]|uniref:HET-domain-containing protein n=1 Tax=Annulohypoxylon maeteangense TaxID=1927788 RepID=UPI002007B2DA|nr:HET-domain-containing protein [Annulohypoxylon maeteangense]KAI0883048.1 HET-domain-containing protein [Annulohypoxylon maeteangense]
MRLINVNTLELEQFYGDQIPRYAILSHTWDGDKEVTFKEWKHRTDNAVRSKDGYAKIVGACRRAQADGLQYLWCDTNCIDKSSSAELTEAINSMFAWYHDSHVCYAYLADVQAKTGQFKKSRWFSRGWTLQELLAPSSVIFFDYRWTVLGDRSELAGLISSITRIHIEALRDRSTIHGYSIAQRMSWAADRQTTRLEDIAYCLLGIFDINMPLLYGEGQKAFGRLQREIIKISNDQSILAWDLRASNTYSLTSALAPSPAEFRFCGSIVRNHEYDQSAYSITNLGISMKLSLMKTLMGRIVLVGLNCSKELHREATYSQIPNGAQVSRHFRIWIPLHRLGEDIYSRTHHPLSKMFLGQSYSILGHLIPTDLFLSLDTSRAFPTQSSEDPIQILRWNSSPSLPCLLLRVAAGKTIPRSDALWEAYDLEDVSIVQVKSRGASQVSHQFISSGDFSILLSVFWDADVVPRKWLYTVIYDPKRNTITKMASQTEWACIFYAEQHAQPAQCCNNPASMYPLHEKLQKIHATSLTAYVKVEEDPIITIESRPLWDSFGQAQLIVTVIFRKKMKI